MDAEAVRENLAAWLRQGISPRRLALTLALGFTIGCVPVVGAPTVLCATLALALGLNMPAIQAANYIAMPFQLILIVPFLRLGARLWGPGAQAAGAGGSFLHLSPALLHTSPAHLAAQLGGMAGQAMLGWLLVAIPAAMLMTVMFNAMLRRIPAVSGAGAED